MEIEPVEPWEQLRSLMEANPKLLNSYLHSLSGSDAVRALLRLTEKEQRQLLLLITPEAAADIIEDVPDEHAADLIESLPIEQAATIINEMESDEQADVLAEIEPNELQQIFHQLPANKVAAAIELMAHDPYSAGGLMVREFLFYPPESSVGEVLRDVMSPELKVSRSATQFVYVTDQDSLLLGAVRVRDLIGIPKNLTLRSKMQPVTTVNVETSIQSLHEYFEEDDEAFALAVTTDDGHLAGLLLRSDVEENLIQRSETDHLKSFGIVGGEELRTMPLRRRSGRRLSWLTLNIGLNVIAASVIAAFEDTLSTVIILAVFLPIVSDMSGCSGNQALAVSMRELTLGIINSREALRVWWKEIQVGAINGLVIGLLVGTAAWFWKGNLALGIVIGAALSINTVIAVSIGGTVPLMLKRLQIDPAVASGPVLTTVTDVCGFLLLLGLATLSLPLL